MKQEYIQYQNKTCINIFMMTVSMILAYLVEWLLFYEKHRITSEFTLMLTTSKGITHTYIIIWPFSFTSHLLAISNHDSKIFWQPISSCSNYILSLVCTVKEINFLRKIVLWQNPFIHLTILLHIKSWSSAQWARSCTFLWSWSWDYFGRVGPKPASVSGRELPTHLSETRVVKT